MIRVLGYKRIAILMFLVAVNVIFAALLYLYLVPELKSTERDMRKAKAAESAVRDDIANIQTEFSQLEMQQERFEGLKADGFFSNQSRRDAQAVFTAAKAYSGVTEAVVSVKSGVVVEDQDAAKAEQVLLESPVSIEFTGVDDADIFEYINYLEQVFPGYLSVEKMSLSRNANISDTMLRAIAAGRNPPLVSGSISMVWRTMVSRDDYLNAPADQEGALR